MICLSLFLPMATTTETALTHGGRIRRRGTRKNSAFTRCGIDLAVTFDYQLQYIRTTDGAACQAPSACSGIITPKDNVKMYPRSCRLGNLTTGSIVCPSASRGSSFPVWERISHGIRLKAIEVGHDNYVGFKSRNFFTVIRVY